MLILVECIMLDVWDNKILLLEVVEMFFDGYGYDLILYWFIGNLV